MINLEEVNNTLSSYLNKIQDLEKEAANLLKQTLDSFFVGIFNEFEDIITEITWNQADSGYNDGDSSYFQVSSCSVTYLVDGEEYSTEHGTVIDEEYLTYFDDDDAYKEFLGDFYKMHKERLNKLNDYIQDFEKIKYSNEMLLKVAYGESVLVTYNKDGCDINDYDY